MLDFLERAEHCLALLGRAVTVFFMAVILVFMIGQAADRYFINSPFNAYDQIAQLALVWLTFLGFVLALRGHMNIRADLIDSRLSPRWLRARNIMTDLVALLLFGVVQAKIWTLVQIGSGQVIMGTPFTSASTFMALAVGSAFGIVILVVRLILDLSNRAPRAC